MDDWVHVLTVERPSNSDGRELVEVGLAVRGFAPPAVAPDDIRLDLACGRGPDLRSWFRVSIRRSAMSAALADVVTELPIRAVTLADGTTLTKQRAVNREEIRGQLRRGVQCVVAAVGTPLAWIPKVSTFSVWKVEIREHMGGGHDERGEAPRHDYAYTASLWTRDIASEGDVILFEKWPT